MNELTLTHSDIRTPSQRRVLAATSISYVIVLLDTSIVNVALNTISDSWAIRIDGLQWVVNAYTLAFAGLLLTGGTVGDRWGASRAYLTGLVVFAAASVSCGLAVSLPALVAGRALQGVGAALIVPSALALINHAYPVAPQRARAVGIWMASGGVAMAAGPLAGGVLIEAFGWRSIFFVNVPIASSGIWLARSVANPQISSETRWMDLTGLVSGVAALGVPIGVFIEGQRLGWGSAPIIAGIAVSLVAMVVFVAAETHSPAPMLPPSLFRNGIFAGSTYVSATSAFIFYGLLFMTSLYFQQVRGLSPLGAGVALMPMTVMVAVGGYFSDRIAHSLGTRSAMCAAFGLYAAGALGLASFGPHSPYLRALLPLAVIGLAAGFVSPAATAPALGTVARARSGIAAATLNSARQSGSAAGVAVFGILPAVIGSFETSLRVALAIVVLLSATAGAVWLVAVHRETPPFDNPATMDTVAYRWRQYTMAAELRTPRAAWIEAGLSALAHGGPEAVRVETLATALGVTKGGFYGHFADRATFLAEVLDVWERESIDEVIERVERDGGDVRVKLRRAGMLTLSADRLLPIDLAVRDWARRDDEIEARLRRVDNRRMDYLRLLFGQLHPAAGAADTEARCLLAFSLLIGNHFIAAEHAPWSRAAVLDLAMAVLEAEHPSVEVKDAPSISRARTVNPNPER